MTTILTALLFGLLFVAEIAGAENGLVTEIYDQTGLQGGLVVELGSAEPQFTADLGSRNAVILETFVTDSQRADQVRAFLETKGRLGTVTVSVFDGKNLPYADGLVNMIVLHGAETGSGGFRVADEELQRVLAPGGRLCVLPGEAGERKLRITRKPWPKEIDQWTHFLHSASGNAVAADRRVAPANALQWLAEPKYCRSHEIESSVPAMVSADGRLVYILDEGPIGVTDPRFPPRWRLIARDAFSGILLWKQSLDPWGWTEWNPELRDADWRTLRGQRGRFPAEVPRRLVAVGDRVYVTLGFNDAPLSILDAATGKVIGEGEGTRGAQEIVVDGGTVFVKVQPSAVAQAKRRGGKAAARLTALDAATGASRWSREVGQINPLTLAAAGGAVVFLRGSLLCCHDQSSGELRWETDCPQASIVVVHKEVVLASGKAGTRAFSLADGKLLWEGPEAGRDLFVIDDLVWRVEETAGILAQRQEPWPTLSRQAGARLSGYNYETGAVSRTIEVPNAMSPGHHLRCYRSKATERFISCSLRPSRATCWSSIGIGPGP